MPQNYIDAHCHLDLFADYVRVLNECEKEGVYTLSVTTTPRAWPCNLNLTFKSQFVRVALGLHPQLIEKCKNEFILWESFFPQAHFIGEVGLDASPNNYKTFELQKIVFKKILTKCDRFGGKVLSIHCVRSITTVLDLIEEHLHMDRNRVILHWFTGNSSDVRRALDLGCYFSINAEVFKNSRHQKMLEILPLDRILLETDGPFCQLNGKPMRPKDISFTMDLFSKTRKIEPTEIWKEMLLTFKDLESYY